MAWSQSLMMASTPSCNWLAFSAFQSFLSASPNFTASLFDPRTRKRGICTSLSGCCWAKEVAPPVSTKFTLRNGAEGLAEFSKGGTLVIGGFGIGDPDAGNGFNCGVGRGIGGPGSWGQGGLWSWVQGGLGGLESWVLGGLGSWVLGGPGSWVLGDGVDRSGKINLDTKGWKNGRAETGWMFGEALHWGAPDNEGVLSSGTYVMNVGVSISTLQCPPYSCQNPVIPVESRGIQWSPVESSGMGPDSSGFHRIEDWNWNRTGIW